MPFALHRAEGMPYVLDGGALCDIAEVHGSRGFHHAGLRRVGVRVEGDQRHVQGVRQMREAGVHADNCGGVADERCRLFDPGMRGHGRVRNGGRQPLRTLSFRGAAPRQHDPEALFGMESASQCRPHRLRPRLRDPARRMQHHGIGTRLQPGRTGARRQAEIRNTARVIAKCRGKEPPVALHGGQAPAHRMPPLIKQARDAFADAAMVIAHNKRTARKRGKRGALEQPLAIEHHLPRRVAQLSAQRTELPPCRAMQQLPSPLPPGNGNDLANSRMERRDIRERGLGEPADAQMRVMRLEFGDRGECVNEVAHRGRSHDEDVLRGGRLLRGTVVMAGHGIASGSDSGLGNCL